MLHATVHSTVHIYASLTVYISVKPGLTTSRFPLWMSPYILFNTIPPCPSQAERRCTFGYWYPETWPRYSNSRSSFIGFLSANEWSSSWLAVLVFKALHGLAPRYWVDDCRLWLPTTMVVRYWHVLHPIYSKIMHLQCLDHQSSLWNNLPSSLRQFDLSLRLFHWVLKMHLL